MPLQNRVTPFGDLSTTPARGMFMGNRGSRFHTDAKTLTARRWASRQWICCVLDFKGRQRDVWGRFYTELFFLDEPTALAAGHRPCFECRRKEAQAFAGRWQQALRLSAPPKADEMDRYAARRTFARARQAAASARHRHVAGRCVRCAGGRGVRGSWWARCCAGRRKVTIGVVSGRAVSRSMCSRCRRFSPCCLPVMSRIGTRVRRPDPHGVAPRSMPGYACQ